MKILKNHLLILTLILFVSCSSIAQQNNPDYMANEFFNIYKSKDINQALDYIFSTNKFISNEDIKLINGRISQYSSVLGEYYGKELFIKEKIGELLEIHSYILKYERQPIRFILTFYKPNNDWKIYNFKINDDFVAELESATIELGYKKLEK